MWKTVPSHRVLRVFSGKRSRQTGHRRGRGVRFRPICMGPHRDFQGHRRPAGHAHFLAGQPLDIGFDGDIPAHDHVVRSPDFLNQDQLVEIDVIQDVPRRHVPFGNRPLQTAGHPAVGKYQIDPRRVARIVPAHPVQMPVLGQIETPDQGNLFTRNSDRRERLPPKPSPGRPPSAEGSCLPRNRHTKPPSRTAGRQAKTGIWIGLQTWPLG